MAFQSEDLPAGTRIGILRTKEGYAPSAQDMSVSLRASQGASKWFEAPCFCLNRRRNLDRYVISGGKRLRCGVTTGTCAAAAARAAAELLLTGAAPDAVELSVPAGGSVRILVERAELREGTARCCVRKDAGDDPDVTDGAEIWAEVSPSPTPGVEIDGGTGVGRVTLPGLDQPVGSAAINSVPRRMIREAVEAACRNRNCPNGFRVIITIPEGEALARKTFNSRLGIVGGLSVLGTSGIVEPMSEQALIESIRVELKQRAALGRRTLLLTPGNYGRDFLLTETALPDAAIIRCSNFIGDALDSAAELGFQDVLLTGHLGKLVKLAGNMFNTHSRWGDCRMDILTAHAACAGVRAGAAQEMLAAATVDRALDVLEPEGLLEPVLESLLTAIERNLRARTGRDIPVLLFTNVRGALIRSRGFDAGMKRLLEEEEHGTFCRRGPGGH